MMKTRQTPLLDYDIVTGIDPADLAEQVNHLLVDGWELWGPPFTFKKLVCQAIVTSAANGEALFHRRFKKD